MSKIHRYYEFGWGKNSTFIFLNFIRNTALLSIVNTCNCERKGSYIKNLTNSGDYLAGQINSVTESTHIGYSDHKFLPEQVI